MRPWKDESPLQAITVSRARKARGNCVPRCWEQSDIKEGLPAGSRAHLTLETGARTRRE